MKTTGRSLFFTAGLALGLPILLPGQPLYLIKGALRPDGSSAPWRSEILRVDEQGRSLSLARDLGTDKFDGISFCIVNYEHRKIVLGMPSARPTSFLVVEMDDVQNPITLRPDFNQRLLATWEPLASPDPRIKLEPPKEVWAGNAALLFHANFGLALGLDLYGPNGIVDYALPLGRRSSGQARGLSRSERAAVVSSGDLGIGYYGHHPAESISSVDVTLKMLHRGGPIDLGIPVPRLSAQVRAAGRPFLLNTNDSRAMVLHTPAAVDSAKAGDGSSTVYIYDKTSRLWRTVTVPGDAPLMRSIGKYVLGVARTLDRKKERQSVGKAEFEQIVKNVRWQDGIAASGAHNESYYGGILFAIDVRTGKMFQWRTNQADSEILWADDAAFYYRRANELLKVELVRGASGQVIGPASSILKADVLLDVHAAFRGK